MSCSSQSNTLKLLCVDDDKDFLNYILSISKDFNISVEICETVASAKKMISEKKYDAFIFDLKLPDGSGLDLVEDFRIKNNNHSPIAIVSGVYQDNSSFRLLKEKYKIDYVLNKPIYQHQIVQLLSQICLKNAPKAIDDKFNQLKLNYNKTIIDKVELITNLINAVQSHPDEFSLNSLKNALHKIGGSAGSYNYQEITRMCKNLEHDIQEKQKNNEKIRQDWLTGLNSFLKDFKYNFQLTSDTNPSLIEKEVNIFVRNAVYVIDYDPNFLNLLDKEKGKFSVNLQTESDPNRAIEKMNSGDFHPRIVLISESFPNSSLTAFDIIEILKKNVNYLPVVFGIILNKENLDARVNAAKKGFSLTFLRPLTPKIILETISKVLESAYVKDIKVLVLDDDQDVCRFIEVSLNEIGINVKTIMNPVELYAALEDYAPHVLLLDILLPKYDGLDLLKTLRSDPAYRDLIVVIITHYKDQRAKEMAYSEQVNDILYKPLEKNILQTRVLNLATNFILSEKFFPEIVRIGLNSFQDLIVKLYESLRKSVSIKPSLAIFEINNISNLILQQTKARTNQLLISISNLIIGMPSHEVQGFFIRDSKFALIFEDKNLKNVENEMLQLLQKACRESDAAISFSCGIVPISTKFENVEEILLAAEQGIKQAKEIETNSPIKIFVHKDRTDSKAKKLIIMVDPDIPLLKIVKVALEAYDFDVKTFTHAEDALSEILNNINQIRPSLIISARKIPDMDGLEFFDKVKSRVSAPIPFYFLTAYASDQDISEGLKHGALQYITKPFNMSLLIQKVIKTVYSDLG